MTEAMPANTWPNAAVAALLAEACSALGGPAQGAWWVPGRIELLGKHVDYCGGTSLVCATDCGLVVVAARCKTDAVIVHSRGQTCIVTPNTQQDNGGWRRYVQAVVERLGRDFPSRSGGVEIAIASNLPQAAGLSSSSALVVGLCEAVAWAWRLEDDPRGAFLREPEQRFTYWSCMESGKAFGPLAGDAGVGTAGGSQDHAAIGMARAGCATAFAYDPLRCLGAEPLPAGYSLAVLHTGVIAEKTGAAKAQYNRCAELAGEALAAWNRRSARHDRHLALALETAGSQALLDVLDGEPRRRAEHFVVEMQCVEQAYEALRKGDADDFAASVGRSGEAAARLLGNQVPQTLFAVEAAVACGALAASPFGAGFGGAVWAMFPIGTAAQRMADWQTTYRQKYPAPASLGFAVEAAAPLTRLELAC